MEKNNLEIKADAELNCLRLLCMEKKLMMSLTNWNDSYLYEWDLKVE